jgi:type I restriction enzyme S subunit
MGADVSRDGRFVTPCIDFLTEEGAKLSRPMPAGTLTLVCSGDVGTPSFLAVDACIHDGFLALTHISPDVDPDYLYEVLSSFKTRLERSATHGGVFTNLTTDILRAFSFVLPPLKAQKAIASVLRTWDEAIEQATTLAKAGRRRYNALRRTLTVSTGGGREYPTVHLTEITKRIRRKNDGKDHPVMTVSAKSGFLLQSDKYARDMAGSSVENYVVLHRGEFAYNKGNSLTSPQGCIFRLAEETALVPHVYFCFALNDSLHSDFFVHLFESGYLNHQLSRVINSGVRNDGLLNLNPDDFFKCRVPFPTHEGQIQIAQVLNDLKRGVELQEKYANLLKAQKRGLMQKLLTGKWKVTV